MSNFSVHFSMRSRAHGATEWKTEQYPINRPGQAHSVAGVDPSAAAALRRNRQGDTFLLEKKNGAELAAAVADGGRVAAYEKPAYNAAIFAIKGMDVQITDETGHWRDLKATDEGAKAFTDGVRGTHMAPGNGR